MEKVAALRLNARAVRYPLEGGVEVSLRPLTSREQLRTLVGLALPSLEGESLERIWRFVKFLLESCPLEEGLEVEVSWEGERIGLSVWGSFPNEAYFQEKGMTYGRFETAMGLLCPEVSKGVVSSLWTGVRELMDTLKGDGYPYGALRVEIKRRKA